jgi:eukaryotic-like serine/threonine-protein kinase
MADSKPTMDTLFDAAIEIESASGRTEFLDKSCGDNHELRQQIELLLKSHEQLGSFLEKSPMVFAETLDEIPSDNLAESKEAVLVPTLISDVDAGGSRVLSALEAIRNMPGVSLPEGGGVDDGEIPRTGSKEIPKQAADSRYQLHGEIARGGMGAIIKGRDIDLGRDLAIKVLLGSHKDNPLVIQRFVEEAQIGGQLQHPGIAPVYELGQFADKRPFFSMKLVKGQTLAAILNERKSCSDDRGKLLGIFEQICQTMAYAHSRSVIHRDLKPANIMVGAFGEVQVMDWGLAKVLRADGVADENPRDKQNHDSVIQTLRTGVGDTASMGVDSANSDTQMGIVMGTPAYMPPEQALGEIDTLDRRADVFGLGAILCEILTGQPPYVNNNGKHVYRLASLGKVDDCFARLSACDAGEELIALSKHCLAPEPNDRPRDAGELASTISGYLQSVETKLREKELERATQSARADEERKRRRVQVALAGTLLLLVMTGGTFAWWKNSTDYLASLREARQDAELASLLDSAQSALNGGDSERAKMLLSQAGKQIDGAEADELNQRYLSYETESKMLEDLEAIDNIRWTINDGRLPRREAVMERWAKSFADYGIMPGVTSATVAKRRINESTIRERLLASLETWFLHSHRNPDLRTLLAAIDTDDFRNEVRETTFTDTLVARAARGEQPPPYQPAWFTVAQGVDELLAPEIRHALLLKTYTRFPDNLSVLMALGSRGDLNDPKVAQRRLGWCRAALGARPRNPAAWNNLGVALVHVGKIDRSIVAFKKAIELAPDIAQAHNNLGAALFRAGKIDEAIAIHKRAAQIDPGLLSVRINLALEYIIKRDMQSAELSLEDALRIDPKSSKAYSAMGVLWTKRDPQKAVKAHRKAVELNPAAAEAHRLLGAVLAVEKQWNEAIVEYREAIRLVPNNGETHYLLGVALKASGLNDEAVQEYRAALRLGSTAASHFRLVGAALAKTRDLGKAIEAFLRATELEPTHAISHYNLGLLYAKKKQYPQASAAHRKAIELNPKKAAFHAALGAVLAVLGEFDEARVALEKATKLSPKYKTLLDKLPK